MAAEKLKLQYVPLDEIQLWEDNPKLHDLDGLKAAIRRHGFLDPPRFDQTLGAVPAGNGRIEALRGMEAAGEELPRGVARLKDGRWALPVVFGCDAETASEAMAYAVDHNNLVAVGGGLSPAEVLRMWDEDGFRALFERLDEKPITMGEAQLELAMRAAAPEEPEESGSPESSGSAEGGAGGEDELPGDNDFEYRERYAVVVECENEEAQREAFERLTELGYTCKVVAV